MYPSPALSAILTIQPSVLNEIMENTTMTGRGLIARFLYASPPSKIGSRIFRAPPVPAEISEAYRRLVFRLMAVPVGEDTQTLCLSEKALEAVDVTSPNTKGTLPEKVRQPQIGQANTSVRCCGLPGCCMAQNMEPGDYEISASTIRRAIEIGKYFLAHSSYAYSMMGGDLNIKKAKFVMAKLSRLGKSEVKRSELFQAWAGASSFRKRRNCSLRWTCWRNTATCGSSSLNGQVPADRQTCASS